MHDAVGRLVIPIAALRAKAFAAIASPDAATMQSGGLILAMIDGTKVDATDEAAAAMAAHMRGVHPSSSTFNAADMIDSLLARAKKAEGERDEAQCVMSECYQAVGMLGETMGLSGGANEDFTRLQDMLAYGATQDGKHLLPFPLLPNYAAKDAEAQRDAALAEVAALKQLVFDLYACTDVLGRAVGKAFTPDGFFGFWNKASFAAEQMGAVPYDKCPTPPKEEAR
jgi:hypothetical protein